MADPAAATHHGAAWSLASGQNTLPGFGSADRRLSDRVASYIRGLIVSGELPTGAKVREVEIASRLGVSRAPVREAILQLQRGNLIEKEAHRGAVVRCIDRAMLRDIGEVRGLLEGAIALEMSRHGDGHPGVELLASRLADMKSAAAATDSTALAAAHIAFHRTFIQAAHNRVLADVLSNLWEQTITFLEVIHGRFVGDDVTSADLSSGIVSRHEALFQAIISGNQEAVRLEMERHVTVPENTRRAEPPRHREKPSEVPQVD